MTDIFERAREQQRKLYEKLNQQPASEVTGVVTASGVGGSISKGEELWTLRFTLFAWRTNDGTLQNMKLEVRNQVTRTELDEFQEKVSAYGVVRVLVRIGEDDAFDFPQAVLLDLIEPKAEDKELQSLADDLQKPVLITTKKFKKLTLDRNLGWYEGSVRIGLRKVRICLKPEDEESTQAVIEVAERLWSRIRDWDARARERATEELLSVKNECWLDEHESPVTPEKFKNA